MKKYNKHYEALKIQPWDIMKANFSKEEWTGYIKGNIIKYTLRDKGQNEKDITKIIDYANQWLSVESQTNEEQQEQSTTYAMPLDNYSMNQGDTNMEEIQVTTKKKKSEIIEELKAENLELKQKLESAKFWRVSAEESAKEAQAEVEKYKAKLEGFMLALGIEEKPKRQGDTD